MFTLDSFKALSLKDQLIVYLFLSTDFSIAEIAKKVKIPRSTVYDILRRSIGCEAVKLRAEGKQRLQDEAVIKEFFESSEADLLSDYMKSELSAAVPAAAAQDEVQELSAEDDLVHFVGEPDTCSRTPAVLPKPAAACRTESVPAAREEKPLPYIKLSLPGLEFECRLSEYGRADEVLKQLCRLCECSAKLAEAKA